MKSFLKWLSTPYYFNPSAKFKFKMSLAFGFFVFIFLYLFEPFSLSYFLREFLFEYTLSIGIITFLGALFVLMVPPLIFKDYFNEDSWTVGRNLFLIMIGILFVGTVLWFNANFFRRNINIESISLHAFLWYTFLVGAIPSFFIIFINEKEIREKRVKKALQITNYKL